MTDLTEEYFIETYNELYHNAQCGYLTWIISGDIVRVNETLCHWLGYSDSELRETIQFMDLLPISGKIYYETHFAPLLFIQGSAFEIQIDLQTKNGALFPVLVNARLKKTATEPSVSFIQATFFDIRQRKQYEKELLLEKRKAEAATAKLKAMNEELQQFARIVSHDLKSPLSGIIALSELLLSNQKNIDEKKLTKSLGLIHQSSKQLNRYIDGLLHFYRTEQEYCEGIKQIDLQQFIRSITAYYTESELQLTFHHQIDTVLVNPAVLEQVYLNLITNAINYNDKEVISLEFGCHEMNDYYSFYIKDNGQGIPRSKFDEIFGLFTTIGVKDRFNRNGTGIGLATVKKLIESAGGSIQVSSEKGIYTQFDFTLKKCI